MRDSCACIGLCALGRCSALAGPAGGTLGTIGVAKEEATAIVRTGAGACGDDLEGDDCGGCGGGDCCGC